MTLGRYAPSPSGRMHLGNLCCCLPGLAFGKRQGGGWCCGSKTLTRSAARGSLPTCLKPTLPGSGFRLTRAARPAAPPRSLLPKRADGFVRSRVARLAEKNLLYPCFCSRNELHAASAPHLADGQVLYAGACRNLTRPKLPKRARPAARPGG